MHAAQPQQPRRAAASAAVPLEYFQCVYSHTTHSALTAASLRSQSAPCKETHLQPLFQHPIRSHALPAATAAIPTANQKPSALSSTAAAQQQQQRGRVAS